MEKENIFCWALKRIGEPISRLWYMIALDHKVCSMRIYTSYAIITLRCMLAVQLTCATHKSPQIDGQQELQHSDWEESFLTIIENDNDEFYMLDYNSEVSDSQSFVDTEYMDDIVSNKVEALDYSKRMDYAKEVVEHRFETMEMIQKKGYHTLYNDRSQTPSLSEFPIIVMSDSLNSCESFYSNSSDVSYPETMVQASKHGKERVMKGPLSKLGEPKKGDDKKTLSVNESGYYYPTKNNNGLYSGLGLTLMSFVWILVKKLKTRKNKITPKP